MMLYSSRARGMCVGLPFFFISLGEDESHFLRHSSLFLLHPSMQILPVLREGAFGFTRQLWPVHFSFCFVYTRESTTRTS